MAKASVTVSRSRNGGKVHGLRVREYTSRRYRTLTNNSKWFIRCGVLIAAALVVASCASTGGGGRNAKDDMEAGYKAAKRGYWQEALLRFQTANAKEPGQVRILNNLAVALEAVARYDEAKEVYEQAMEIAPADRNLSRNYKYFQEFYEGSVLRQETEEEAEEAAAGKTEEDKTDD
jgi:tetratricopeptide (TPR) repeat protein